MYIIIRKAIVNIILKLKILFKIIKNNLRIIFIIFNYTRFEWKTK